MTNYLQTWQVTWLLQTVPLSAELKEVLSGSVIRMLWICFTDYKVLYKFIHSFTKYQLGTALCQVKNHLGIICISKEILHVGDQMQVRYY